MKLVSQIKILVLILFIFIPDALGAPSEAGPRGIVDVRTGIHKGFHRLVIELDGKVGYSIRRQDNKVLVLMSGTELKSPVKKKVSTDIIKFEGITVRTGKDGPVVSLKVAFRKGSLVQQSIRQDPFRIIVDFYTEGYDALGRVGKEASKKTGVKAEKKVTKKVGKEASKKTGMKAEKKVTKKVGKEASKKTGMKAEKKAVKKTVVTGPGRARPKAVANKKKKAPRVKPAVAPPGKAKMGPNIIKPRRMIVRLEGVPFNDGWRLEYRKKVMLRLKQEIDGSDTIEAETLRAGLGLKSTDRSAIAIEADALASALRDGGETGKASVIDALIDVFEGGTDWVELEQVVRNHPGSGLERLGWFFIARRFEAYGFHLEALAFYSRVESDFKDDAIGSAATFSKARLRFFMGRFDQARAGFAASARAGYRNSQVWLANTFMIEGEVERALAMYGSMSDAELEAAGPLALWSIGDASMITGDLNGALNAYEKLYSMYRYDDFMGPYFLLKKGDVSLGWGEIEEAVNLYASVKDTHGGEARVMASLSLAGQLAKSGETESLAEAEDIYEEVAGEDYAGAVFAELNMASTEALLGAYETAFARLKRFGRERSTHREYVKFLRGSILHSWIDKLYKNKNYYKVIKVVSEHGSKVPLGKRAETYMRVGNSYAALNLLPDAVKALSAAREAGRPRVAEGAMISLGHVYLSQRDPGAVVRLMNNFSKRFPDTRYESEAQVLIAKAAYMRGDYKTYLGSAASSGDPDILRARALKGLGRYSEALALYKRAVSGEDAGDAKMLTAAYIGAADCSFMLRRYTKAVAYYNSALARIGEDGDGLKSWALYRITQSYSRLHNMGKVQETLDSIGAADDTFGRSAASLFKGPARNF